MSDTSETYCGWANLPTWTMTLYAELLRGLMAREDIDVRRELHQTYTYWLAKGIPVRQARALAIERLARDANRIIRNFIAGAIDQASHLSQVEKYFLLDLILDTIDRAVDWEQLASWVWDNDVRAVTSLKEG